MIRSATSRPSKLWPGVCRFVKPASSRTADAKTGSTGDASTSELKKAIDTLNAHSDFGSEVQAEGSQDRCTRCHHFTSA